ncbi:MAG: GGDEF domain-containing protein [Ruminococcaceae bacterium]|nr:GGDEF domain-containing protein [Oscillospiraceae bacterium]
MGKNKYLAQILQAILLFILIIIIAYSMWLFDEINGTARVINYSGIARGGAQRIVKLESNFINADERISYIDGVIQELKEGGTQYHIKPILLPSYQEKLQVQKDAWNNIKLLIYELRDSRSEEIHDALIADSEAYFDICNETVSAAEDYSQALSDKLRKLEILLIVILAILASITIYRSILMAIEFRKNVSLSSKAYTDPLTGAKSRTFFDENINSLFGTEEECTFIFIDIDRLKYVNDTYGHEEGDNYIKHVVERIKSRFRTTDILFRLGGDEFGLFLGGCKESIALGLIDSAREDLLKDNTRGYECSFSYGTVHKEKGEIADVEALLNKSDERMYRFKKEKRKERK